MAWNRLRNQSVIMTLDRLRVEDDVRIVSVSFVVADPGCGQYINFFVQDDTSLNVLRMCAFGANAVNFEPLLIPNKVYLMRRVRIKQYQQGLQGVLESKATITLLRGEEEFGPVLFNFEPYEAIHQKNVQDTMDRNFLFLFRHFFVWNLMCYLLEI